MGNKHALLGFLVHHGHLPYMIEGGSTDGSQRLWIGQKMTIILSSITGKNNQRPNQIYQDAGKLRSGRPANF